jgi:uncharacterized protein
MSQENVEIVRTLYEAFVRGQWDLAALMLDPDVELHGTVGGLEEGTVARGLEQIRDALQGWDLEAWDERRFELEEFVDAGDRVVVLQREFRRGRGSGLELETNTAVVFDVRNGRVVRLQGYMDQAEALKAAGLRE